MPLMVTTPQREALRRTTPGRLPQGLAGVLAHNYTRVIDLFRVADENLDGVVSKTEFHSLLNKLGIEVRDEELHDLFSWLDPDASGGIEFRELQSALRQAADAPPASAAAPAPAQRHGSATRLAPTAAAQRPEEEPGPPTEVELRLLREMLDVATAGVAEVRTYCHPQPPTAIYSHLQPPTATLSLSLSPALPLTRTTPPPCAASSRTSRAAASTCCACSAPTR